MFTRNTVLNTVVDKLQHSELNSVKRARSLE
jgi:hypothetical protein